MPDAFDFQALKRSTPGYLGMESLREALPNDAKGHEAASFDAGAAMDVDDGTANGLEDVSMIDQERDVDEDTEQVNIVDGSGKAAEPDRATGIANIQKIMSPTQYGAQMALRHRESEQLQEPKQDTRNEEEYSMLLAPARPQSSETQSTNSLAPVEARSDQDMNHYDYEIRMPIPAPWEESLPYILSTYLQVAFNAFLLCLFGYFVNILRYDVSMKVEEKRAAVVRDATWCQHQYVANRCGTGRAPPHLTETKKCLELEACMEANPNAVRWLSMYASLAAEVLEELVKPLTFRTMMLLIGTLAVALGVIFAVNYTFGFVRARAYFADHDASRPNRANRKEVRISAVRAPHADSSSIWRRE